MVYDFGQVASDVNQVISNIDPMTSKSARSIKWGTWWHQI